MQPELQLNFRRGSEGLTLELRHEIATAEFLVITHRSGGDTETDNVDRFGDVDQAMAYLRFVEGRLADDNWSRNESVTNDATEFAESAEPLETIDESLTPLEADATPDESADQPPVQSPDESPDPLMTRPIAQLYRINLPPLPPPPERDWPGFAPTDLDATFPEESPFASESKFTSKPAASPAASAAAASVAPLPAEPPAAAGPGEGELGGASYALERPLYCPHCREWIRTIIVVRLSRMHVPFTSTLPRSGRALACSACQGVLSLELSGFV